MCRLQPRGALVFHDSHRTYDTTSLLHAVTVTMRGSHAVASTHSGLVMFHFSRLAALGIFYGILNPLEGVMEQIRRALSKTITIQMPGNAANCFGLYCLRKFALQVIVLVHRLLSQRSDF